MRKQIVFLVVSLVLTKTTVFGQEKDPVFTIETPFHNALKINRNFLNPTFSIVGEDRSRLSFFHRNQSVEFDAYKGYFVSYGGRVSQSTGVGLSVFQLNAGVLRNFGAALNYARNFTLGKTSSFSLGANVSYFATGVNREAISGQSDAYLLSIEEGSVLLFQPGINFQFGKVNFGLYAENLIDYNLKNSSSISASSEKRYRTHLGFTQKFKKAKGSFKDGKLAVMAIGRHKAGESTTLGGNLLLDYPKLGWLQAAYDDFYGVAVGLGFNLTDRISLGYTLEKGIKTDVKNLGTTHELSFSYSFLPSDAKKKEQKKKDKKHKDATCVNADTLQSYDQRIKKLQKDLEDNNKILSEILLKQDSLMGANKKVADTRYRQIVQLLRTKDGAADASRVTALTQQANTNTNAHRDNVFSDTVSDKQNTTISPKKEPTNFIEATKAQNIRQQVVSSISGIENGYYIIANVYSQKVYLDAFMDTLNKQGLSPKYFNNPKNNLDYVWLAHFATWQEAIASYHSNVNGRYDGEIWIMSVGMPDYSYTLE